MKNIKSKALTLKLEEILDREFVKEVLDRKLEERNLSKTVLLRSSTCTTIVRKNILKAFVPKSGSSVLLSDLAKHPPHELKRMAGLGKKTLRWLEEYLHLVGVKLPQTRSVYGLSKEAQDFLASL
jgi:hypothetical protein